MNIINIFLIASCRNVNVRAGVRYERLKKELVSLGSEVVMLDYNQPESLKKVFGAVGRQARLVDLYFLLLIIN